MRRLVGGGLGLLALAGCSSAEPAPDLSQHRAREVQVRPDTPGNGLMFKFDAADVVETYGSVQGNFLVHFTRAGKNGVPPADADMSGVPDFVEELGALYEDVLKRYHDDLGFRAPLSDQGYPDNGGDGRFDVYLVDFNGQGDGNFQSDVCTPKNAQQCAGYMIEENDFKGYPYPSTTIANRILSSHEFFHAVQAAYDDGQGSVLAEGTAVWATETFDPTLDDFEGFLPGYFDNPDRPVDQPLPSAVDPFSYGAAIYFDFLEEHHGAGTIKKLWESVEDGANGVADPKWFQQMDTFLKTNAKTSFADSFVEFATWNLFTGALADPTRSYKNGAGYSAVARDKVTAPYSLKQLRMFYASSHYFELAPKGRAAMGAALVPPADAPTEADGLHLLYAVRHGNAYDPIKKVAAPTAGTETIDTQGADSLVVYVVNGTQANPSKKPGLCIGTTDEIASCKTALLAGSGGAGGAGGSGGAGGAGTGGSPTTTTTTTTGSGAQQTPSKENSGCSCDVPGSNRASSSLAALSLAALAALAAQRLRRRPRAKKSASGAA